MFDIPFQILMSDISVPPKFLKPFYKFRLSQLNAAELSGGEWSVPICEGGDNNVRCHMVWVQGEVTSVSGDSDSLVLSDTSGGSVTIDSVSSTPLATGQLTQGQYLQVIGQLVATNKIKCSKVTDLTHNKHCQQMWDLEVSELQNLLAGKIVINSQ